MKIFLKKKKPSLFHEALLPKEQKGIQRKKVIPSGSFPWIVVFLWCFFGCSLGYVLFFSPWLDITEVKVSGESVIPWNEYETMVIQHLSDSSRWINHRNFFLFSLSLIEKDMLLIYPKLQSVRFTRVFPHTLTLTVHEFPYVFTWCSGGPCYVWRNGSLVNLPAAEDSQYDPYRLTIIDESSRPVKIPGEDFDSLPFLVFADWRRLFSENHSLMSIDPIATMPSRYADWLTFSTREGWYVFIPINQKPEVLQGVLEAFFAEFDSKHGNRKNLEWIDLRVEGKVFYALKQDSMLQETLLETQDSKSVPILEKNER